MKVFINGDEEPLWSVAEGNGPVNALDQALRKDLGRYQRHIKDVELVDYKVRILTGGTEAMTRVLVESHDKGTGERWFTVGVSPNIVDASFEALIDFDQLQAAARRCDGRVILGIAFVMRGGRAALTRALPSPRAAASGARRDGRRGGGRSSLACEMMPSVVEGGGVADARRGGRDGEAGNAAGVERGKAGDAGTVRAHAGVAEDGGEAVDPQRHRRRCRRRARRASR